MSVYQLQQQLSVITFCVLVNFCVNLVASTDSTPSSILSSYSDVNDSSTEQFSTQFVIITKSAKRNSPADSDVITAVAVSVGGLCILLILLATIVCCRGFCPKCRDRCRESTVDHQLWTPQSPDNSPSEHAEFWNGPTSDRGRFLLAYTPVLWTPPRYEDLMATDAVISETIATGADVSSRSPPPSYTSDTVISRQTVSSITTQQPDGTLVRTTQSCHPAVTSGMLPASFQSLENIDYTIFGSHLTELTPSPSHPHPPPAPVTSVTSPQPASAFAASVCSLASRPRPRGIILNPSNIILNRTTTHDLSDSNPVHSNTRL